MKKYELLDNLTKENHGILKTSDAVREGVSKTYFLDYVQDKGYEKLDHGIYLSPEGWNDPYYVFQSTHKKSVFSHEAALYLLGLADREPLELTVTVKRGYNTSTLIKQGVKVITVSAEFFNLGIIERETPMGHSVRTYNMERTLCDILKPNSKVEVQDRQTALKEYARRKDKNISLIMDYATQLKVDKDLRKYLEVLL